MKIGRVVRIVFCFALLVSAAYASGAPTDAPQEGTWAQQDLVMMLVYGMVALGFSFLCSVAEAVVLSVSPSYIATLEDAGAKAAPALKRMKKNIDRSLAAILTLNTIAHTVGAGGAGAEAAQYFGAKWIGIAMAVLTLLILFLSEIIPKTIGAVYWRALAPLTARFVQILNTVLFPLIFVSELITKWLTGGKSHHAFNREEFTALANIGAEGGHLDAKESRILSNLFRFPKLSVEDIMTPRTVVFALQQDLAVGDVMKKFDEMHFSRIPIYGENRDDITGFVLKTDLLLNAHQREGRAKLRDLKRDIRAVEQHTPLSQTLEDLLDNRAHLLLVVDKYGGMQGLVTLEDVVETLIGIEIVDEADEIDDMRRLARQKWEARMQRIGIDVREGPNEEEAAQGGEPTETA
jgi:CBS domain containing-hemolysin-like protein